MNEYKAGDKIGFTTASEGALLIAALKGIGVKAKVDSFNKEENRGEVIIIGLTDETNPQPLPRVKTIEVSKLDEAIKRAELVKKKFDSARDRFCFELMTSTDERIGKELRIAVEDFIKYIEEELKA